MSAASQLRALLRQPAMVVAPGAYDCVSARAIERAGFWAFAPWLVFVAAVIVSSWAGGFKSGLVATLLSTVIGWLYLAPLTPSVTTTDPDHFKAATLFVVIGTGVSLMHEQLRRTKREAARSQALFQAVIDHSLKHLSAGRPRSGGAVCRP